MQFDILSIFLLSLTGFVAGGINTVAGGGSNITLPALMMFGLPADIANGTNRVAIFMQSAIGIAGYDKHKILDRPAIIPILIPSMLGGLLGAILAALIPNIFLKPILLLTVLAMSAVIFLRPQIICPPKGTFALHPRKNSLAWWSLFAAGIYGGFVQAGVGFILLAALGGGLRYDLIRANALKMVCALSFTSVALAVFIAFDQVWWLPGFIVGAGSMLGAHLAVKVAIKATQDSMRRFLFAITLLSVVGGFLV